MTEQTTYTTTSKRHPVVTVRPSQYGDDLLLVNGTNNWHIGTMECMAGHQPLVVATSGHHPQPFYVGTYATVDAAVEAIACYSTAGLEG